MTNGMKSFCLALAAALALNCAPAAADNGRQEGWKRHYFIYDNDRDVLRGYIRKHRWYYCPPGTYKRGHHCVIPRGHPVFYTPGSRLPYDVYYTELPPYLVAELAPPPPGAVYVRHYDDIYLIDARTRLVLDALSLFADLR